MKTDPPPLWMPDTPEFWQAMGLWLTDERPASPEQIAKAEAIVASEPPAPKQGRLFDGR